MRRWQTAATVLILMFVATRAFGHGEVVNVGSSASGGGALKLEGFDFAERIVVTPSSSNATMTLYTTTFPSFQFIDADQPGTPLYRLPDGTRLTLEITCDGSVCIDAGASIRLDRIVDATGETASIGEVAAGEHVHPEWRLLLPNGVVGEYRVPFKITTTAAGYSQSQVYTAILTNIAPPTATSTAGATASATATATPSATFTSSPTTVPASATPTMTPTAEAPSATPTPTPTATQVPACPATPDVRDCLTGEKGKLLLVDNADPSRLVSNGDLPPHDAATEQGRHRVAVDN
jgi:hypothetical protein